MSRTLIQEGLIALKEVFNRPYELEYTGSYPGTIDATAMTEDERIIEIRMSFNWISDILLDELEMGHPNYGNDNWEDIDAGMDKLKQMGMSMKHSNGQIMFQVDDSTDITGRGDATRILATVVEFIKTIMNAYRNIVSIEFTGQGLSRQRLYRTMIRRLGRIHNMYQIMPDSDVFMVASKSRAPYLLKIDWDNIYNTFK